jgi:hypothetical protein
MGRLGVATVAPLDLKYQENMTARSSGENNPAEEWSSPGPGNKIPQSRAGLLKTTRVVSRASPPGPGKNYPTRAEWGCSRAEWNILGGLRN